MKAIRGIEFAKCGGYCDNIYHFACCGTTRSTYEMVSSNSFWLCDECRATVNNRCLKELCATDPVIQCVKGELEEIKKRIEMLAGAIDAGAANTQTSLQQIEKQLAECKPVKLQSADKLEVTPRGPTNWPSMIRSAPKRRREEQHISYRDVTVGTNTNLLTAVATVPAAEKKFWIYLSRIHPDVSADNISDLVKECLQCDEPPEIVKLVRKDVDLKLLRFVSFKIGVDPKFKSTALSPCTWPTGILFREFEEHGAKNGRGVVSATPISITPVCH